MRIALYHNLPSGGAKRTLYEQTIRLAQQYHVDVFTLASANHEFADVRPFVADYNMYNFQPRPLFSSPFGRLNQLVRLMDLRRIKAHVRQIAEDIERGNYDIVLVHPCQFEKCPSITTYVAHTPTVYYCQEPLRRLYEKPPPRPYDDSQSSRRIKLNRIDPLPAIYHATLKNLDRENTRNADKVVVNSRFIQESVKQIYQVDSTVSYHGVDSDLFQPVGVDESERPFLFSVGSLTPLKGFDFLIKSLGRLPLEERPPLVIVSNSQNPLEKQYLEELAGSLGVQLELLDNVSDKRLVELYNQAYLTIYSPVREPFGLVPLESMACGTVVVAVNEGGIQETILHEKTGLLIERDPDKFAAAIQYLLTEPELVAEYGFNGRETILKNWTWERAVATLENHLATTIGMEELVTA